MKNHNLSREKKLQKQTFPHCLRTKTTKIYAFLWMLDLEL